jgi:hypothetical protein
MSASRVRARLRKVRQRQNLSSLSQEDKKQSINAVRNFVLFGGKRGKGTGGSFAEFVARFPLAKDKVESATNKRGLSDLIRHQLAIAKEKLRRRKRNKLARKQRVRA